MSLRIHRAERTDLLADGLATLLEQPLADPFAQEVVVVPARGVERWLTQRLSHRLGVGARGGDGVCAGVRFLSPHSLVSMLIGRDLDDPWDAERLVWTVLEVIDESLGEQWCATLATHLGHEVPGEEGELRRSRRYSVARRIAGLFTSYAAQRPQLLTDWREDRDTDGCGGQLDPDLHWQAELWRRVVSRRDVDPPEVRHRRTLAALATGGDQLELPARLSLFGHTRLPRTEVELLGALGALRDVHLWLPQPSPLLWDDLAEVSASGPTARADDRSAERVRHPLLASLGRDSRELQRTLALADGVDASAPVSVNAPGHLPGHLPDSLLGHLQAELRENAIPTPWTPDAKDTTIQVHACHGPSRQVDVLREVLVGLLADDPTLEPRDILVMCPDIETYAPLIQAGFGLGEVTGGHGHPAHRLRVRLADRALSSTNPLLTVAARLVEIAGGRVTATEVLDLLGSTPVRHRFAVDEDDLDQVARWVDQAGIRWGMDAAGRADYSLGRFGQNTWRAGLDRVLLGVAMAEDEHQWLGPALPVDDVSSGDIDLVGRLAEYVDRLDAAFAAMTAARSVEDWVTAIGDAVLSLTDVERDDAWQVAQFERELATIRDAVDGGESTELRLSDVRNLLTHRLSGRPTRANFRTGTLTVCTMVPMRSVPHRVVCLIGLDDGVFPRTGSVDGDDVLAREPQTGERDVRSEDRQLLLDAVLAATERLVITYTGANEQTGAERPPAVPLGELLDAVARTAPGADVLTHHPLQPFDRRNLVVPGLTDPDRAFSFDSAAADGARAALRERSVPGPLITDPLPARTTDDVSLTDLQQFFAHPARAFLRRRLDVSSPLEAEETLDAIPIELDALEKWGVGDRLLRDVLDGLDPVSSMTAEQLRGLLPPAQLGQQTLRSVVTDVQALVQSTEHLRRGTPRSVDVDVDLGNGRRLTGTVSGIRGNRIVSVTYSSLRARQRLESWINLLALSASRPDEHWTASSVGKGKAGPQHALAGPLDHRAVDWLRELVDLHDRGLREPLPLPLRTGLAYAEASVRSRMGDPKEPVEIAEREWRTNRDRVLVIPGEQDDAAHARLFGDGAPISVLTTAPRADENFNDEPHRLGQYAWQVWSPLLSGAEQVSSL